MRGLAIALAGAAFGAGSAGAGPPAHTGAWENAQGARSSCTQVAGTTVACTHTASAGGATAPATSRCQSQGVTTGGVVVAGLCKATLVANTSGPGHAVTPGFAPGCSTFGLGTGLLTYEDANGTRTFIVNVVNAGGTASFYGTVVDPAGAVSTVEGGFTFACGTPDDSRVRGDFHGTFTTAAAP